MGVAEGLEEHRIHQRSRRLAARSVCERYDGVEQPRTTLAICLDAFDDFTLGETRPRRTVFAHVLAHWIAPLLAHWFKSSLPSALVPADNSACTHAHSRYPSSACASWIRCTLCDRTVKQTSTAGLSRNSPPS